MPDYGLSDAGYTAPRAADVRALMQSQLATRLAAAGLSSDIDWDADVLLSMIVDVMAERIGSISDATQALYDAWNVNSATAAFLDNLCLIVGTTRIPATYSTCTVTLTGTSGTIIPAGKLIQGGGPAGTSRWATTSDVTLSGGTGSVVVQAQDAGAIDADAASLTTIVTPVSGWTAVTNAAPATPGEPRETDAALRLRRQQSLQVAGSRSLAALRANLLALDGIQSVVVVENTEPTTETVSGISLTAHSVGIVVYPSTLTTAQKTAMVEAIYGIVPAGIATNGAQSATVTGGDGFAKTIQWAWATTTTVNVVTTVILEAGYELEDVEADIQAAVEDLFLALAIGQPAYNSDVVIAARTTAELTPRPGVKQATATLNGGASVTPAGTALLVLGTNTVTE